MPISGGGTSQGWGSFRGDQGVRMVDETHDDIDQSKIDITVSAGSVEVILRERIWSDWTERLKRSVGAGQGMNQTVDVDSDWYDGDHELVITAQSPNTRGTYTFNSADL